jgi:hypothetical protein
MAHRTALEARPRSPSRDPERTRHKTLTFRLGFWSAVLMAGCSTRFLVLSLAIPSPPWHGPASAGGPLGRPSAQSAVSLAATEASTEAR